MPFELGLAVAQTKYLRKKHLWYVFEAKKFRALKSRGFLNSGPFGQTGPKYEAPRFVRSSTASSDTFLCRLHRRLAGRTTVGCVIDLLAELVLQLVDGLCVGRT
jgi:hypothetical protein